MNNLLNVTTINLWAKNARVYSKRDVQESNHPNEPSFKVLITNIEINSKETHCQWVEFSYGTLESWIVENYGKNNTLFYDVFFSNDGSKGFSLKPITEMFGYEITEEILFSFMRDCAVIDVIEAKEYLLLEWALQMDYLGAWLLSGKFKQWYVPRYLVFIFYAFDITKPLIYDAPLGSSIIWNQKYHKHLNKLRANSEMEAIDKTFSN